MPLADSRRLYEALRDGKFVLAADSLVPAGVTDGYDDRVTSVITASPRREAHARPPRRVHRLGRGHHRGQEPQARPTPWQQATADEEALAEHATEIRNALARWCGVPARPAAAAPY